MSTRSPSWQVYPNRSPGFQLTPILEQDAPPTTTTTTNLCAAIIHSLPATSRPITILQQPKQ